MFSELFIRGIRKKPMPPQGEDYIFKLPVVKHLGDLKINKKVFKPSTADVRSFV